MDLNQNILPEWDTYTPTWINRRSLFVTPSQVYTASMVAMMAGSDFIKTSTGKESVNATLPIGLVMIRAIQNFHARTGKRVSGWVDWGGIHSLGWVNPHPFSVRIRSAWNRREACEQWRRRFRGWFWSRRLWAMSGCSRSSSVSALPVSWTTSKRSFIHDPSIEFILYPPNAFCTANHVFFFYFFEWGLYTVMRWPNRSAFKRVSGSLIVNTYSLLGFLLFVYFNIKSYV